MSAAQNFDGQRCVACSNSRKKSYDAQTRRQRLQLANADYAYGLLLQAAHRDGRIYPDVPCRPRLTSRYRNDDTTKAIEGAIGRVCRGLGMNQSIGKLARLYIGLRRSIEAADAPMVGHRFASASLNELMPTQRVKKGTWAQKKAQRAYNQRKARESVLRLFARAGLLDKGRNWFSLRPAASVEFGRERQKLLPSDSPILPANLHILPSKAPAKPHVVLDHTAPKMAAKIRDGWQSQPRAGGRFAKAPPPAPPTIPTAVGVRGHVTTAGGPVGGAVLSKIPTRSKIRPITAKLSFERWRPVRVPALRPVAMPLYAQEELSKIAEMEKFAMPGFAAQAPAAGRLSPAEGRAMLDEIWRQEQALMAAEAPPPAPKKAKAPPKAERAPDLDPWMPEDGQAAERAWLKKNLASLRGFDTLLCRPEAHLKFAQGAWRAAAALLCLRWPKDISHPGVALADLAAGVASGHLIDPRPMETPRSALSWPDGLRQFANLQDLSGDF